MAENDELRVAVRARVGKDRSGQIAAYLDVVNNRVTALAEWQTSGIGEDGGQLAQQIASPQHTPVIRQAMTSLAGSLRAFLRLDDAVSRQIAEGLLEPDHAKRQAFVRQIGKSQGLRAAKEVDRVFSQWLGQYVAAPAGAQAPHAEFGI